MNSCNLIRLNLYTINLLFLPLVLSVTAVVGGGGGGVLDSGILKKLANDIR